MRLARLVSFLSISLRDLLTVARRTMTIIDTARYVVERFVAMVNKISI
jgi:hypothetical protein